MKSSTSYLILLMVKIIMKNLIDCMEAELKAIIGQQTRIQAKNTHTRWLSTDSNNVYIYIYIHIHYTHIYIYIYIYIYTHTHIIYIYIYINNLDIYIYIYIYIYISLSLTNCQR